MCVFCFSSWTCKWTIPSLSMFNIIVIMFLICIKFLLYLHVFVYYVLILNRAIKKDNYNIGMPEEFVHQNITIKNKTQIATKFNQFFANLGSELSENVPLSNNRYTHYLKNPNGSSYTVRPY